ncbi:hypothetical protein ACROYT_G015433 [Oculina patagonica]
MKWGGYMDSCIKVARLYRGKEEIEDLLPLTVKQEPDNTTSPMATETAIPKAEDTEPSYDSKPEAEEYKGEDAEDYALQEEFFKEPNPKTIRHKWLVLFYRCRVCIITWYRTFYNLLPQASLQEQVLSTSSSTFSCMSLSKGMHHYLVQNVLQPAASSFTSRASSVHLKFHIFVYVSFKGDGTVNRKRDGRDFKAVKGKESDTVLSLWPSKKVNSYLVTMKSSARSWKLLGQEICVPGMNISVGLFIKFYELLLDACAVLDAKIATRKADTDEAAGDTDLDHYITQLRRARKHHQLARSYLESYLEEAQQTVGYALI